MKLKINGIILKSKKIKNYNEKNIKNNFVLFWPKIILKLFLKVDRFLNNKYYLIKESLSVYIYTLAYYLKYYTPTVNDLNVAYKDNYH